MQVSSALDNSSFRRHIEIASMALWCVSRTIALRP